MIPTQTANPTSRPLHNPPHAFDLRERPYLEDITFRRVLNHSIYRVMAILHSLK